MVVHGTSLPQTDHLMIGPERLAFLMMVCEDLLQDALDGGGGDNHRDRGTRDPERGLTV